MCPRLRSYTLAGRIACAFGYGRRVGGAAVGALVGADAAATVMDYMAYRSGSKTNPAAGTAEAGDNVLTLPFQQSRVMEVGVTELRAQQSRGLAAKPANEEQVEQSTPEQQELTTAPPPAVKERDLLGISEVSTETVEAILRHAENFVFPTNAPRRKLSRLKGRTQINLFFEPSTRTQSSFELAGKRLGSDVINMAVKRSATAKGETLIDTAVTLNSMRPDAIVMRHDAGGAISLIARKVDCSVINAGDGAHEHPTQALLDALSIRQRGKEIAGLTVAICGDILHSRVARSNVLLLTKLGARVRLVAPHTLLPAHTEGWDVEVFQDFHRGIANADAVMMLRLQSERMQQWMIPSREEYYHYFGLNVEKLAAAKPEAFVMHPGPVNRGVEIDSTILDNRERSLVQEQVSCGVAVRMAVLDIFLSGIDRHRAGT